MYEPRRRITIWLVAGALAPPVLAYLGYLAAGSPHVDCDEAARTTAFYHVAVPFFGLAGLVAAAALVQVARIDRRPPGTPYGAVTVAALPAAVALPALLPGTLHHPAGAIVAVLGVASLFGTVVTVPVTAGLVGWAGVSLVRGRHRGTPDRGERRLYVVLLAWAVIAVLPELIVLLSLNADPLCFTF